MIPAYNIVCFEFTFWTNVLWTGHLNQDMLCLTRIGFKNYPIELQRWRERIARFILFSWWRFYSGYINLVFCFISWSISILCKYYSTIFPNNYLILLFPFFFFHKGFFSLLAMSNLARSTYICSAFKWFISDVPSASQQHLFPSFSICQQVILKQALFPFCQ